MEFCDCNFGLKLLTVFGQDKQQYVEKSHSVNNAEQYKKKRAFVLSGGEREGRCKSALCAPCSKAGYRPDLVTGSSIGAANGPSWRFTDTI